MKILAMSRTATENTETEAPFGAKKRDWVFIWRAVMVVLGIIGAAGGGLLLFSGKAFIRAEAGEQVSQAIAPMATIPAQVRSLEEFRNRQEKAQEKSDAKFETVQSSLATLAAQQNNTDKKVDRVLDAVERLNRRTGTTDR